MEKINTIIAKLVEYWNLLPKEPKVAVYVVLSYLVTDQITYLQNLEVDNRLTMGLANLGLVFLLQIKSRVDTYKAMRSKAKK